ncbi:MAG: hypothetical protein EOO05_22175 [Chitinophagaceae bacterium]|nr:MAG: hypothetical protein EOO05_22175 [Chitinophagaceae bacterium]
MNVRLIPFSLFICIAVAFAGCGKQATGCENPSLKGRIIGYNPCAYFSPDNDNQTAGVVIEVDHNSYKDTILTYSVPARQ